ncbi:RHS repeat-associated core domain-containing protein [Sorangium sp. So ce1036]|uniref:RHS repeat-associated core domain-containing protein n=1 Tax=Sorangium sp. So ce1036 TaxID=3133328 RepID=UPI003F0A9100
MIHLLGFRVRILLLVAGMLTACVDDSSPRDPPAVTTTPPEPTGGPCNATGGDAHVSLAPAGAPCSDGDACNGDETCDGRGACVAGTPPAVDDGNPCTVDVCDAASGVVHRPAPEGAPCPDSDTCNGEETCDGAGTCVAGSPPAIDDGDPCTLDICDPTGGIARASCSVLDRTVATAFVSATAFLYSGPNPAQVGVAPGTLLPHRAAVIRGQVRGTDGAPLAGITVSVEAHPEVGTTITLADGTFLMAVNGGGPLTVTYEGDGYLRVARQVDVPWQDYVTAGDVVMTPYDSHVTVLDLASPAPISVARGSVVADADGVRQATLLFPAGTGAEMLLPDGTTEALTTLSVRATEYTVGEHGPAAMPAALPPASAYTYAVELSVDEAVAAGATAVQLTQPVPLYVDNFLGFPVGMAVPAGYYDWQLGAWIPSDNGRILGILGVAGDLAEIDLDGDGRKDEDRALLELGITDEERRALAELYAAGTTLWRVPLDHFTPWDLNWPWGPPPDACTPMDPVCAADGGGDESSGGSGGTGSGSGTTGAGGGAGSSGGDGAGGDDGGGGADPVPPIPMPDACEETGSVIECENQILGESVPIAGTPLRLHYRSDRVPGRKAAYALTIPLSRRGVPASLERIDLVIEIAGRRFEERFACPCEPNSETTFSWDGKDAFGRTLEGAQPVTVRVGYVYRGVYMEPAERRKAFADFSSTPIAGTMTRDDVTLWKVWRGALGTFSARSHGLGGWTLSEHHAYEPIARVLHLGDGRRRRADALGNVLMTVAGHGCGNCVLSDGEPATQVSLYAPSGVTAAPDGGIYIADSFHHRVRRVGADGVIETVAGTGEEGSGGDGGPATAAQIEVPRGLALGPDGSLYITEQRGNRVRRVAPDGTITTVAGTGAAGYSGDGGPATLATLRHPFSVAVGLDGSVYIADRGNHSIRRVAPDGIMDTVAGTGASGFGGDGGPAEAAVLRDPRSVALQRDGSVVVVDTGNDRVRRIDVQGTIRTIAGTGAPGSAGDGDLAVRAQLRGPVAATVGHQGELYVADDYGYRVRRIGTDGVITTIAGRDNLGTPPVQDGQPAAGAYLGLIGQMHVGPDRDLYLAEMNDGVNRVRRIAPPPMAGASAGEIVIPAEDGDEAYVFDGSGKHLRTVDTRTGATLFQMSYDSSGLLIAIADVDGDVTAIERDARGTPLSITGPFGQATQIALNADGYLWTVTNPAAETVTLTYGTEGLLTGLKDALDRTHTFTYDAAGLLVRDEDPAGGRKSLTRAEEPGGYGVTVSTALGRSATYHVQSRATGALARAVDLPSGLRGTATGGAGSAVTMSLPDGRALTWTPGADPRFGMLSPFARLATITTPGGRTMSIERSRTADLANPADALSFSSLVDTTTVNGRSFVEIFSRAERTVTRTTPAGRQVTTTLDNRGRLVKIEVPGLLPVDLTYDAHGRLEATAQGGRTSSRGYGLNGYLDRVVDPLLQATTFMTDAVGRALTETRPDLEQVTFGWDAAGNQTSITPPGRPSHQFSFSPVDLLASYAPPDLPGGPAATTWGYDVDRKLGGITKPGGAAISFGHDDAGRRTSATFPGGSITWSYELATGKLAGVSGPAGVSVTYGYDGHLLTDVRWSGAVAGAVYWTHDDNFRVSSESVNGAFVVSFMHDDDGLLTAAGDLVLSRDPQNGRLTGTTLGNVTETVSYNGFGELVRREAKIGGVTVLLVEYERDALGRILERTETIEGETRVKGFEYDPAGRLVNVFLDGALAAHYDLDANGNRLSRTSAVESEAGTYDDQDRLLTYDTKTYAYQDSGELRSRTDTATGETTLFDYSPLGHLRGVALPSGAVIEYVLDGLGRRVGKKVGGTLVKGFLYEGALRPIAELDGTGAVVARFIYGERINVPDAMIRGGVTYRILTDAIGSVRLVIDAATGTVAQRMNYDEFGRIVLDTNPGFTPFGFAGGLYDPDTGLVRFGARDYDPEIGRWTAKDPLLFDGCRSQTDTKSLEFSGRVGPSGDRNLGGVRKCRGCSELIWHGQTIDGDDGT